MRIPRSQKRDWGDPLMRRPGFVVSHPFGDGTAERMGHPAVGVMGDVGIPGLTIEIRTPGRSLEYGRCTGCREMDISDLFCLT